MTIARVTAQQASGSSATSTLTINYPGPTTAGHLLVAALVSNTVANGLSGWTAIDRTFAAATWDLTVFYKISVGERAVPFTATSATVMNGYAFQFSGTNTAVVDTSSGAQGTTVTSLATAAITTTEAADMVFVAAGQNGGNGGSADWATSTDIQANVQARVMTGFYLPGTTLTGFQDTASWTTARSAGAIAVAFKAGVDKITSASSFAGFF